jgi:antitoxin (DNA-binding transcriptional repressor) of toxin-antitoxin stability system
MKLVSMHEAKTQLSRLVDLALAGEDVIIARRKQPLVRLSVLTGGKKAARSVGALPGLVRRMGDDFNESLEDWEEAVVPAVAEDPEEGGT